MSEKGVESHAFQLNLENSKDLQKFCKKIKTDMPPDILINNAAVAQKDFQEISANDLERIFQLTSMRLLYFLKTF